MKACLVNYNFTPDWLSKYPGIEPLIYDRSDDGIERNLTQFGEVRKTPNFGDVDHDKLTYLIENYDNLPEVFLWSKTNLFKFIDQDRFDELFFKSEFAPLLTLNHKTYSDQFGVVNFYSGNMYHERADSWFFHAGLDDSGNFANWSDWCKCFNLPMERYIPFAPGGSYILTRERVHRHGRDLYEAMRDTLPYAAHPLEAHCCERSYFYLWR